MHEQATVDLSSIQRRVTVGVFCQMTNAITLERQLEILAECGIAMRSGITVDDLFASFDRAQFESQPFELLLVVLGGELEREPYPQVSDNIWHFDTECIEGHGDFARIARRMSGLAGTSLPIADIEDYVDVEEGEAWLSFRLDGERIKWDAEVDDDWADTTILSRFAALLERRNAGKRFTYCDLGGQDCLIGCATPEQLECLNSKTGMPFDWLD